MLLVQRVDWIPARHRRIDFRRNDLLPVQRVDWIPAFARNDLEGGMTCCWCSALTGFLPAIGGLGSFRRDDLLLVQRVDWIPARHRRTRKLSLGMIRPKTLASSFSGKISCPWLYSP